MKKKTNDLVTSIPSDIHNSSQLKLSQVSYAGYAKVPYKKSTAQLFYWFFEARKTNKDHANTPIILWLNGGPGSPSTIGLFLENGPYAIQDTGRGAVVDNPNSWNQNAHMIFWDQPIGTGYSNVEGEKKEKTFAQNEDDLCTMMWAGLQYFFTKHPEYRACPIYLAGESYAGKYIPHLTLKIDELNAQQKSKTTNINLKGIMVGDGWISPRLQIKIYIEYAYILGYLDLSERRNCLKNYRRFAKALDKKDWRAAYNISNNIVENVSSLGGGFNIYDIRRFDSIPMYNVAAYMSMKELKVALNIPGNTPWTIADNSGPVANNLIPDNMENTAPLYGRIIGMEKYKVLMYAATFDTACGALATELILHDTPKWKDKKANRDWKKLNKKMWGQPEKTVKGFYKTYKNLTQIILPGSGHQVPFYLPVISLEMINNWLFDKKFQTYDPKVIE
jgi:vitellogenic carboxypeptidase-like protein